MQAYPQKKNKGPVAHKFFIGAMLFGSFAILLALYFSGSAYSASQDHFLCADVGLGKSVTIHPHTGAATTQIQRRNMIERRLFDCFWRAYRYIETMKNDKHGFADPAVLYALKDAERIQRPIRKYFTSTANVLKNNDPDTYFIHEAADSWVYADSVLGTMRNVLLKNAAWARAHRDPDIFAFLALPADAEEFASLSLDMPSYKSSAKMNMDESFDDGVLGNRMKLFSLTDSMYTMLSELERLHMVWTEAALRRNNASELKDLVTRHHEAHMRLVMQARSADEQTLLTIPEHSPHDICREREPQEIAGLIENADAYHRDWVRAVRTLNMRNAWAAGLSHARTHALLATCGIRLPEINDRPTD